METGVMESNTEHTDCLFFFFSLLINESFVILNSWFSAGRQNDYPYQSFSQVVKCDCYRWCSSTYFQLCCKNEGVIFRKTDCCSSKERSETFTKTPAQINLLGFFFFYSVHLLHCPNAAFHKYDFSFRKRNKNIPTHLTSIKFSKSGSLACCQCKCSCFKEQGGTYALHWCYRGHLECSCFRFKFPLCNLFPQSTFS